MSALQWTRVGLLLSAHDAAASAYREALGFAGLQHRELAQIDDDQLRNLDVLLLCGFGELSTQEAQAVARWVTTGGKLVAAGSSFGLGPLLGLHDLNLTLPHGRVQPAPEAEGHGHWPPGVPDIRVFGASLHEAAGATVVATLGRRFVAASEHVIGRGYTAFTAAHLGRTLLAVQMGRSVECDGIGPTDGTARLDDGKLTADDAIALDFHADRTVVAEGTPPLFATPYVDAVREMWLRQVVEACARSGKAFLMLWHWPKNANATTFVSFETGHQDAEPVRALVRATGNMQAKAVWLSTAPGYGMDVYRAVKGADHEAGLAFDAHEESDWEPEKLKVQHLAILRASQSPAAAIRPAAGQWYRHTAFYEMLDKLGAHVSLAKGGRMPGTQGFPFGGCLPTRPMRRDGSLFESYEWPYQAFLPGFPDHAAEWVVEQCRLRHGCFHMAVDGSAATSPSVFATLQRILTLTKANHMRPVLPGEWLEFDRARRALRMQMRDDDGPAEWTIVAPADMKGLTLMIGNVSDLDAIGDGSRLPGEVVRRYGHLFWTVQASVPAKLPFTLRLTGDPALPSAA